MKPFTISLLAPEMRIENDRHRNLYVMDVSNKQQLEELHEKISEMAIPYRSPFIREKTWQQLEKQGINTDGSRENLKVYQIPEEPFNPHITLGEIDFDKPQTDITETQKNLRLIEGKEIIISSVTVFWYGKEDGAEKASLLEEVTIPFNQNQN
jgi:2'-5' RNA ligase